MSSTSNPSSDILTDFLPTIFFLTGLVLCCVLAVFVAYHQYQFNDHLVQLRHDYTNIYEQRQALLTEPNNNIPFNAEGWLRTIDSLSSTTELPSPFVTYLPKFPTINQETSKSLKLLINELAMDSVNTEDATQQVSAATSPSQMIDQFKLVIGPLLASRLQVVQQQADVIGRWQRHLSFWGLVPILLLMISALICVWGKIRANRRQIQQKQIQATALTQLQLGYIVVDRDLKIIEQEMDHLELGLDNSQIQVSLESYFQNCMEEDDLRSWKLSLQKQFLNNDPEHIALPLERTLQVNSVSTNNIFYLVSQGIPKHQPKWIITTWQPMMIPCLTPEEDSVQLKKDFNQRLDLIEKLTQLDTDIAGDFFHETQVLLQQCRDKIKALGQAPKQPLKIVNSLLQSFHQIKGDAAILGLNEIAQKIHSLEDLAQQLALSSNPDPTAVQELALAFDKTGKRFEGITKLFQRFTQYQSRSEVKIEDSFATYIHQYAHKIARDCHKKIKIIDENLHKHMLPEDKYRQITTLIAQLLRNAIAHGIELPEARIKNHKTEYGCLHISLKIHNQQLIIKIRDDGQGIDIQKVVTKAKNLGLFDFKNKQKLSQQELLNILTLPGLSTKDIINEHAGRGVGLDLVKNILTHLKGTILLDTRPGQYTEFSLSIPV